MAVALSRPSRLGWLPAAGHVPGVLAPVAELPALDQKDIAGGKLFTTDVPRAVFSRGLVQLALIEQIFPLAHAGQGVFEGPFMPSWA